MSATTLGPLLDAGMSVAALDAAYSGHSVFFFTYSTSAAAHLQAVEAGLAYALSSPGPSYSPSGIPGGFGASSLFVTGVSMEGGNLFLHSDKPVNLGLDSSLEAFSPHPDPANPDGYRMLILRDTLISVSDY